MTESRRQYSKEFKTEAVELLLKKGKPATQIAGDLGIWVCQRALENARAVATSKYAT